MNETWRGARRDAATRGRGDAARGDAATKEMSGDEPATLKETSDSGDAVAASPGPRVSASPFVSAARLTKTYQSGRNRVVVFQELSLTIAEGEMVAIVGP